MSAGRIGRLRLASVALVSCLAPGLFCAASALAEEAKFNFTGTEQQFKVPAGVTSIHVVAIGSEGEKAYFEATAGGVGAVVSGDLAVSPDQTLYVEVGGQPFNGGGPDQRPGGGSGGGASDVRTVSIGAEPSPGGEASLLSRLLVAAGGGGGGYENHGCGAGTGGAAEEKGANGANCGLKGGEGGGAAQPDKGGVGGASFEEERPCTFVGCGGEAGKLGVGGIGGIAWGGGGGGGGRYGGGGGGIQDDQIASGETGGDGGGGGGSNLVPAGGGAKLANVGEAASVTITYTPDVPSSIQQCMKNGWKNYATKFKNQGQCVKFVENTPS